MKFESALSSGPVLAVAGLLACLRYFVGGGSFLLPVAGFLGLATIYKGAIHPRPHFKTPFVARLYCASFGALLLWTVCAGTVQAIAAAKAPEPNVVGLLMVFVLLPLCGLAGLVPAVVAGVSGQLSQKLLDYSFTDREKNEVTLW